jgi:hypothetical protein
MSDRSVGVGIGGLAEADKEIILHRTGQQTKSTKQLRLEFFTSSFYAQFNRDNKK